MRNALMAAALGMVVAACGPGGAQTAPQAVAPAPEDRGGQVDREGDGQGYSAREALPDWFDCLREEGGLVIAAHRGGPAPGYPENALETLQRGADAGLYMFEVDVAETADGEPFLLHDDMLERTTTGEGRAAERDWDEIAGLRLVDNDGRVTGFAPPRLADALEWAVAEGVVLELDAKRSASYETMVETVRAAGAGDHVILISYTAGQARALNRAAPEMMLTADAFSGDDVDELRRSGIDPRRLIAWTGNEQPDPRAFAALRAVGVEPAFGTLGRAGERLDDAWRADGDLSEYVALAEDGVVLIATDAPLEVAAALSGDERAFAACGR